MCGVSLKPQSNQELEERNNSRSMEWMETKWEKSKLDDQSEKIVLIGYDENLKRYKLFNPSTSRLVVSRDVEFDENVSWDWSTNDEGSYDFFPYFEDEETTILKVQEEATLPALPISSSQGHFRVKNLQNIEVLMIFIIQPKG